MMSIHGTSILAGQRAATDPNSSHFCSKGNAKSTGQTLPDIHNATVDQINFACVTADEAFYTTRQGDYGRNRFQQLLLTCAAKIEAAKERAIPLFLAETGLPQAAADAEFARMLYQCRAFAALVAEGSYQYPTISVRYNAEQVRDISIRKLRIPIGPVAIWAASNFAFAFSVGGGDTFAAFAAGCPVVFKAHACHPMTSEVIGLAIAEAVKECGFPAGFFSLIQSDDRNAAETILAHEAITAGAFTGSRKAGEHLAQIARSHGKQFFAEQAAVNPGWILPSKLESGPEALAEAHFASCSIRFGQMCTNPGIVNLVAGETAERYISTLVAKANAGRTAGNMLSAEISAAYFQAVKSLSEISGVSIVSHWEDMRHGEVRRTAQPAILRVSGDSYLAATDRLQNEAFGPSTLVIVWNTLDEMIRAAYSFHGSLAAWMYGTDAELAGASGQKLTRMVQKFAGRVCFNKMPTGVEVCAAMNHGGPSPSCSIDSTSVGADAIQRFLRDSCFDGVDTPVALLPRELHDDNPTGIYRRIEVIGKCPPTWTRESIAAFSAAL